MFIDMWGPILSKLLAELCAYNAAYQLQTESIGSVCRIIGLQTKFNHVK